MNYLRRMSKKGILVIACALSAAVILSSGVLRSIVSSVKADEVSSNKYAVNRDTDISVDSNGVFNIKRNEITSENTGKEDAWTLLIYMDGTDLEQLGGCASKDIKEMLGANITSENIKNANIIIQTGGSFFWENRNVKKNTTQRFIINENKELTCLEEKEIQNMGDPDTLSEYLEWGIREYPAENMGVIFWNHGSGVENGICTDPCFKFDSLSLAELEYSFANTCKKMNRKFDIIGFDTCLSGSLEYTNVLAPYADYMVASADTEPGDGWKYTELINTLLENPSIEGKDLGKVICDSYYGYYESKNKNLVETATMTLYDLSKVDNVCIENNYLSKYLYDKSLQDSSYIDELCKMQTTEDTVIYDDNNLDIGSILNYIDKNDGYNTESYKNALNELIVYSKIGKNYSEKNALGLSIYFPKEAIHLKELNIMRNVSVSPYYLQLLEVINAKKAGLDMSAYKNNPWDRLDTYFENSFEFIEYELYGNNVELRMYSKLVENSKYVEDGFVDNWNNNFSVKNVTRNSSKNDVSLDNVKKINNQYIADVDKDDRNKISKVYDSVLVKMGEDTVCLGQAGEATYNSETGKVSSNFNGRWLMLPDGQLLTTYVDDTFDALVYSIPVYINDLEMYIKIKVNNDNNYEVLGIWDGTSNTVYAGRGYIELVAGTIITPIYDVYNEETDTFETEIGEEYTIKNTSDFLFTELKEDEYEYLFSVENIYGNFTHVECVK